MTVDKNFDFKKKVNSSRLRTEFGGDLVLFTHTHDLHDESQRQRRRSQLITIFKYTFFLSFGQSPYMHTHIEIGERAREVLKIEITQAFQKKRETKFRFPAVRTRPISSSIDWSGPASLAIKFSNQILSSTLIILTKILLNLFSLSAMINLIY